MVATDSYRLSVKETKLESALEGELEANVPARTLQELARDRGGDGAEEIDVAALENQVVFSVGDVVLSSRLVEGRFPNYNQLLPETYEHELRVSRRELLDVVRRISLLAQKNAPLRMRSPRARSRSRRRRRTSARPASRSRSRSRARRSRSASTRSSSATGSRAPSPTSWC